MAWLRVDDGMAEHRKILALPRKDRWTWLELLLYVARQNNGGHVPDGVTDILNYVTPAFLKQCQKIGLLDRDGRGYAVHDWGVYNASTIEEKVAAVLARNPDATANEVHREIGGKREIVLHEVAKQQGSGGSLPVPDQFPTGTPGGSQGTDAGGSQPVPNGTRTGSPSRARANPSPTPREVSTAATALHNAAAAENLERSGWTKSQLRRAATEPDRALAWLKHYEADPTANKPGALAWTKFDQTTDWPQPAQTELAPGAAGTRSTRRTTEHHPCPNCGLDFTTEARLVEHTENVHPDEPRVPPPLAEFHALGLTKPEEPT